MREKIYRLIRWSERYTKADMVYVGRSGFWVMFGQISTSILSFLLLIVFANALPKETYGLYRYVISLAGLLNVFSLTGMNQAVSQAAAVGNEGALRTSVKYQLKWNVLMMCAFWVVGTYYVLNHNAQLATSLFVMGLFFPLTTTFNTYGAYLEGKREFRLNNMFSVISTFIYIVGMMLAIMLSGGVVWLVVAYSLSTFAATFIFYLITIHKFNPPSGGATGDVLQYGRHLTFIGLIGPVVSQIDKIILNHFWGAAQLAMYTLAMAIPERATSFVKDWVSIGFPKLALRTTEEINSVFYIRIFQGLLIGLVLACAYIVTAPFLFKYLLPQYLDTVFYSQLLATSIIVAMPNRYLSSLFAAKKLSKLIFINSVIQNIIKLILFVVLGIFGGVLGLVIAYLIYSLLSLVINISMWWTQKAQYS